MRRAVPLTLVISLLATTVCGRASNAESAKAAPTVQNIDSLLSVHLLGDDQESRSDVVAADSLSSVHLTQIRGSVESHHHVYRQETAWIIRGAGQLTLDGVKYKVAAGTVVTIPPGTPHSFYSLGKIPAVVISVFSPAFDGKDRVYENPAEH
jgi:mannose-6-phosphate isomerase-like protein (cupin superfamily)